MYFDLAEFRLIVLAEHFVRIIIVVVRKYLHGNRGKQTNRVVSLEEREILVWM